MRLANRYSLGHVPVSIRHKPVRTISRIVAQNPIDVSHRPFDRLLCSQPGNAIIRGSQFLNHRIAKIKRQTHQAERDPEPNDECRTAFAAVMWGSKGEHSAAAKETPTPKIQAPGNPQP